MRTVQFKIGILPFEVIFDTTTRWEHALYTTCILVTLPEREIYAGASACHPNDFYNKIKGENLAFERAVQSYLSLRGLTELLQYMNKPKAPMLIQKTFSHKMREARYIKYIKENSETNEN